MHLLDPPPSALRQYHDVGGVLWIWPFDDADGSVDEAVAAIGTVIQGADLNALRDLGFREIGDAEFYGDWYDADTALLVRRGTWRTENATLENPRLRDLDDFRVVSGGVSTPRAGNGGQFAYAFGFPPYPLRAPPSDVQALFDKIRHVILPFGLPHHIRDWASPDLVKVSPIFKQGMEWWGVFLFTIYVPDWRRHTVIVGSTTD